MSTHSVAEARNQLSDLIDRAMNGEDVVITRHGQPVATIRPVAKAGAAMTDADIEWLRQRRVGTPAQEDAGAAVSRMRDEDWR